MSFLDVRATSVCPDSMRFDDIHLTANGVPPRSKAAIGMLRQQSRGLRTVLQPENMAHENLLVRIRGDDL